jgi:hypothetical protein
VIAVMVPANRDARRYAGVRSILPRRIAVLRCSCSKCHGVDYLRVGDYAAAHRA